MRYLLLLLTAPILLIAQYKRISPEEIEMQLTEAEEKFNHALDLFNPWYTGPLITPSASMMPPGFVMMQPYIYFTDYYSTFNEDRESVSSPNRFQLLAQPLIIQTGITSSVDTTLIMSAVGNWRQGHSGGGFKDIFANLGFKISSEGLYYPKAKFTVAQSFPTGRYKNLNKNGLGLDATGAGAWQTTFTLAFGKLFLWNTLHPLNTRVAFGYTVPTSIHVTNFNAYGGGFGTHGTVHPGNSFSADLGLELSINQPWVIALDVVYNCTNRTTFSGYPGVTASGAPASVGGGFNDQLSLAPAVEYNFNANMGILWGVWFTVYGRSAPNFVSGIFSWYWVFPG